MSEQTFHNFMVVGPDKSANLQALPLKKIAEELYLDDKRGIELLSPMATKFLEYNKPLANASGDVITGQVLYIPSVHGKVDKNELILELIRINEMILYKLDDKAKQIHGKHHHLLSAMVASAGLTTHSALDLRKSYLELGQEEMGDSLKRVFTLAKSVAKTRVRANFVRGRQLIRSELKNLETSSERYLRLAGNADKASKVNFTTETGLAYKRGVYDIKRIGIDRTSVDMMSRHINATIKAAAKVRLVGKIAIGVSLGEAVYETGETCYENGVGYVCARKGVSQATGLGLGYGLMKTSEYDVRRLGVRELVCNLLLDVETEGAGMYICQVTVPATVSFGFGVAGNITGQYIGADAMDAGHTIVHEYHAMPGGN